MAELGRWDDGFTYRNLDPGYHYIVSNDGVEGRITIREDSDDAIVIDEIWRENVYRFHPNHVKDRVVLDLGANVGAFSLLCRNAGAKRVVSYEPDVSNFAQLQENIGNRLPSDIRNAGVGEEFTRAYVIPDADPTMTGSSTTQFDPDGPVEITPFKWALTEFSDVAIVKMDIEGAEYSCFKQVTAEDFAGVERFVMEFHTPENLVDFGRMVTILSEWGHIEILGRPSTGGMIYGIRY